MDPNACSILMPQPNASANASSNANANHNQNEPGLNQSQYREQAGITVSDDETRAFLFEFIPSLRMIKCTLRERVFLVDLERLASLYARGARGATATPVSRVKHLLNEDSSK